MLNSKGMSDIFSHQSLKLRNNVACSNMSKSFVNMKDIKSESCRQPAAENI